MSYYSYRLFLLAFLTFSSCKDDDTAPVKSNSRERQFVIVSRQIIADTNIVTINLHYQYINSIGNWKYFYLSTSNNIRTGPAVAKLFSTNEPFVNDRKREDSFSITGAKNIPGEYIWVYFGFRGDFYDSTSSGLALNSTFNYKDSAYVLVLN